ncbi:unnamed protein product, partial [Symbiodinium microadriaticum]
CAGRLRRVEGSGRRSEYSLGVFLLRMFCGAGADRRDRRVQTRRGSLCAAPPVHPQSGRLRLPPNCLQSSADLAAGAGAAHFYVEGDAGPDGCCDAGSGSRTAFGAQPPPSSDSF